jgi:hypothetical protein
LPQDDALKTELAKKFYEKYGDESVTEGFVEHEGKAYWVKPSGSYRSVTD